MRVKVRAIAYLGGLCVDCGRDGPVPIFDFHHVNGAADKEFVISAAAGKPWATIETELDKCVLLCSNCHRVRHSRWFLSTAMQKAISPP